MSLKRIIAPSNYLLILFALFLSSCSSTSIFLSKKQNLSQKILKSEILENEFNGFVLYDIQKNKNIININGDKYFTPASNTKVLTFYTSLKILKDSMPLIKYLVKGDSLIFWGTGNPLCLNPDFDKNTSAIDFLINSGKKIYYCQKNFQDNRFGSGWAWDDYLYSYQLEKSAFPIFGNRVVIDYTKDSISIEPDVFNTTIKGDSNHYFRDEFKNDFEISLLSNREKIQIPFITDSLSIIKLIKKATNKQINKCPVLKNDYQSKILKIKIPDTLYNRLLHDSDNFIAEQLIQMCSFTLFDTINTKKAIEYSKANILPGLKDKCRWVDGSGLSRYNLFSPNDMIYVLKMIYSTLDWKQITEFFPTAGISGTLKNSYPDINKPFIYAKSGSLSNNYNLSGYIRTKKGNKYIFSFMNNHFLKKSKTIKKEMENIFKYIYEKY